VAKQRGDGPMSDLDRFLAEIDRLRKKAEGAASPPPAKARPVVAKVVSPPPPPPKPTRRIRIEEPPIVPVAVPVAAPVTAPLAAPAVPVKGPQEIREVAKIVAPAQIVAAGARKQQTAAARNVAAMLANKQSLQLALIMQEILGPPKSLR
jgi:hypothetical protein